MEFVAVESIPLSQKTLRPITIRCDPKVPLARGDADASDILPGQCPGNQKGLRPEDSGTTTMFPILARPTQPESGGKSVILSQDYFFEIETERLFRPRRRRRARTLRPAFVDIRRRKPWVRLREMLLGWKVRFMASAPKWLSS